MLGPILKKMRERAGYTQNQLGFAMGGEDPRVLGRMEQGIRSVSPDEAWHWHSACTGTVEDARDIAGALTGGTWEDLAIRCGL